MNQQRSEPAPSPAARSRRIDTASWLLREARRRQRSGQALTEFALVVPLLLLVIYAIIIFALAVHTQIDFGNAISSGIRAATVDANGLALANANVPDGTHSSPTNISQPVPSQPSVLDVDNDIGNAMVANLRSDDQGSVQEFSVQLIQGRPGGQPNMPDRTNTGPLAGDIQVETTGAPVNVYLNVYCAVPAPASAPVECRNPPLTPRAYNPQAAVSFDQDSWNWASHWPGISYCKYYYQAHKVIAARGTTVYLDRNENIVLYNDNQDIAGDNTKLFETGPGAFPPYNVLLGYPNPRYPKATDDPSGLGLGCGRVVGIGQSYPADDAALPDLRNPPWDCSHAWNPAAVAPAIASPNNLCFYYPSERNTVLATGDKFPLPDLVEVKLQYLYNPIPTELSTKTPLGNGFTITEHARGRLEPAVLPGT